MKNKTILLTGSSGFIGNFFLRDALNRGYKIIDILRYKNKANSKLNYLRKKYRKSYRSIYFKKNINIQKKLKDKKIDYFINFATLYKDTHLNKEIPKFIESNILFPTLVLDAIFSKCRKIINFGTMMEHTEKKYYSPKNLYASTKSAFEIISEYYFLKFKKVKLYHLKFYESFSRTDDRPKLIPILIKNYKKKTLTKIISNKLELNIIDVEDILKAIYILLNNSSIKSGTYCLKQKKNLNIRKLILKINKKLKRKIKIKFLKFKIKKPQNNNLKILPKWKPDIRIEKKIEKEFYYANH